MPLAARRGRGRREREGARQRHRDGGGVGVSIISKFKSIAIIFTIYEIIAPFLWILWVVVLVCIMRAGGSATVLGGGHTVTVPPDA